MRKIKIWFKATFLNYPYWRVRYKDGRITYKLYWLEAKGLAEVFNGELYIDYKIK